MDKKTIAIIGHMNVETEYLIEKLDKKEHEIIGGYNFYKGEIEEYPIVIVVAECMLINAAVATYITIERFNPIAIINVGVAGGFGYDVHKKDLVIGKESFNIISCKTPVKSIGEGSSSLDWELMTFISGEKDREIFLQADSKLLEIAKTVSYEYGKIHVGVIGSGDIWNREADRILYLNKKYNILCSAMEGIAIHSVAQRNNIPVIEIRTISDNELLKEDYERECGLYNQKFVYEYVKKIIHSNFIK